ncbi:MAG: glycoside hydrolase family 92 protein, partial [Bacteroidetes bacterium]|nr:glycoside hydrolase family 92 protein [Bacteroidota bacterium]
SQSCSIRAFAQKENVRSKTVTANFAKWRPVGTLALNTRYSPQYTAGGDQALLDGVRGSADFHLGGWQGYEQTDLDAVVDLGSRKKIKTVSLACLQDNNSWIFFPTTVSFEYSEDGLTYSPPVEVANDVSPEDSRALIKEFTSGKNIEARFVRIRARNLGVCPPWHKGRGEKAWLFVDEISIVTLEESQ